MELCNYPNPDQTRCYEIKAIEIPIVYNKYGAMIQTGSCMC